MAQTIKLKRSATSGAVPTTTSLALGEVAINTHDGKVYIKKDDGAESVIEVGDTSGYLPLSGGTLTGDIALGDNDKATFGASDNLEIYSDGTNGFIKELGTGSLAIQATDLFLQTADNELYLYGNADGAVSLYHNGQQKFITGSSGVAVTGEITADGLGLGDNDKATFGASDDLQIYHDGTHSYVSDQGTGSLFLRSGSNIYVQNSGGTANYFKGTDGGAAELFHNGSTKLATTSTGIDVTGTATMDGLSVNSGTTNTVATFESTDSTVVIPLIDSVGSTQIRSIDGAFAIRTGGDGGSNANTVERMRIDSSGNVGVGKTASGYKLDIEAATGGNGFKLTRGAATQFNIFQSADGVSHVGSSGSNAALVFRTGTTVGADTERMRIDSSGNLLVGTTALTPGNGNTDTGHLLKNDGRLFVSSASNSQFNRNSDGDIVAFRQSGNLVGSIGTGSGVLGIGQGTGNLGFLNANVIPMGNASGGASDGVINLGNGNRRFKDLHLSGTAYVNTSVGIGTTSPVSTVEIAKNNQTAGSTLSITNSFTGADWNTNDLIGTIDFRTDDTSTSQPIRGSIKSIVENTSGATSPAYTALTFSTAAINTLAERMRIDASGNLLVGKPTSSFNLAGTEIRNTGVVIGTVDGAAGLIANRLTSDGTLIQLSKDGTTVGSIGSVVGQYLRIGSGDVGIMFQDGTDAIEPRTTANANRDAAISLGASPNRFKNLHLSGTAYVGTSVGIGTSNPERKVHIFNGESSALASNANSALVIEDDSNAYISFLNPNFLEAGLLFGDSADNDAGSLTYNHLLDRMSIRAGGSSVLSIESTGIDVTGTATMDGLTVDGATLLQSTAFDGSIQFTDSGSSNRNVLYLDNSDNVVLATGTTAGARGIDLYTNNSKSLSVAEGGDISFYEDTGTTPKMVWDASAEMLTTSGLTVETATGTATPTPTQITIATSSAGGNWSETDPWGRLAFYSADTSAGGAKEEVTLDVVAAQAAGGVSDFFVKTYNAGLKNRIKVGYEGDISFYEDTGTTAKFFWDASAESLGIGTSSPANEIHIKTSVPFVKLESTDTGYNGFNAKNDSGNFYFGIDGSGGNFYGSAYARAIYSDGAYPVTFYTNAAERMRIDSSGNVGIGTDSPTFTLEVNGGGAADNLKVESQSTLTNFYQTTAGGTTVFQNNNGNMAMFTGGSERMRIDTSGNLLVGKSSADAGATAGFEFRKDLGNLTYLARAGNAITLNRLSSDGDIALFRKDGTTVGSIGTGSNELIIGTADTGLRFYEGGDAIIPRSTSNDQRNGTTDLGASNARFKDLYLSGGVKNTSSIYMGRTDLNTSLWIGNSTVNAGTSDGNARDNAVDLGYSGSRWKDLYLSGGLRGDTLTFGNLAGSENMRLFSSGNLSIGTTSSIGKLTVSNNGAEGIEFFPANITGGNTTQHYNRSGSAYLINNVIASEHRFLNSGAEKMRLNSAGHLLHSTTSTTPTTGGTSILGGNASLLTQSHATGTSPFGFFQQYKYNSSIIGSIARNGNTGVYFVTSSDERLKENIADSDDAGSKIDAIQVRKYDWKVDGSHQDYGMIAQELVEVAPEAVSTPEDSEEMMGIDYSKLVPMLIKEIQSLRNRVAQLEE